MPIEFINMTPHPIAIIRPGASPWTLAPSGKLARATEGETRASLYYCDNDSQGDYASHAALHDSGLADVGVGYTGVEDLPTPTPDAIAFGHSTFYVVSITTVLGALAAGRTIGDLVVPMGQVRDGSGRVIGATSLAPADTLLTPMAATLSTRWRAGAMSVAAAHVERMRRLAGMLRGALADQGMAPYAIDRQIRAVTGNLLD